MTLEEYQWRMNAFKLRQVDEEFKRHQLAYLNTLAGATEKNGKPKFKNFDSFYNYQNQIDKVLHETDMASSKLTDMKKSQLTTIATRVRSYREGRGKS